MSLTLKQLREEVRAGVGDRSDVESQIDRAINIAQTRIARASRYTFDEFYGSTDLSTTANDPDLDISSITGLRKIYSVMLIDSTSSRRLVKKPNREWDKIISALQSTTAARSIYYSRWGNSNLELYPTPDAVYTIRVKWSRTTVDLTDDNPATILVDKDDMIIEYARHHIHKTLGNKDEADRYFRNFRNMFTESIEADQTDPDRIISPGSGGGSANYHLDPFVKNVRTL